jgi:hypothetical protein
MRPSRIVVPVIAALACVVWMGCSSNTNPTARIAVLSQVGQGTHTPNECQLGPFADWVTVGKVGDARIPGDPTTAVNSGDVWAGHTVTATACNVSHDGDGFQVNVSVTVDGQGSFTVNGHFTKSPPFTAETIFQRGDTGSFKQEDCAVTYPREEMGIDGGRVWAHVDCPNIVFPGQHRTCAGTAEFRFENCTGA